MTKRGAWLNGISVAAIGVLIFMSANLAYAESSSSAHYEVTQTQFGTGSALDDCSATYCGKISIGNAATGSASSADYFASFGSDPSDVPLLEVITQSGTQNLGTLTTSSTASASTLVKVLSYLSGGYSLLISGASPSQGTHNLHTLSSPTTSQAGTEQFGINLVANTSPSIGANVAEVPTDETSFGVAASAYATANHFKYVNGDEIASSPSSSGETDYTISMIVNVSNVTPAGSYNGSYSVIAVPVY